MIKDEEIKNIQEKIWKKSKIIISVLTILFIIILIPIVMHALKEESLMVRIIFTISCLFLVFVFAFAAYFITEFIINGKDTNYVAEVAKETAIEYFESSFTDVKYEEKGYPKEKLKNIINTWNYYVSNDYMEGKYKNIHFEVADVMIGNLNEREEDPSPKKKFFGKILVFDNKEKKSYKVHIEPKKFSCSKPLHAKVFIEDETFDKTFNVSTDNERDAINLLTPSLIEKIINLKNKNNCDIMIDFRDGKILFAINNKRDSFEYDGYKKVNSEIIKEQDNKEIEFIKEIIDEFNKMTFVKK